MSRQRFFFSMGVLTAAVLLIVASVAGGAGAIKGVGLGIGSASLAVSLLFMSALVHHRRLDGDPELRLFGRGLGLWSAHAGCVAGLATWEIIDVGAFGPTASRWLTLANGVLIAALGCAGLVAHEICSVRVVHVLEVVERPR
jgi:hypothetical protein